MKISTVSHVRSGLRKSAVAALGTLLAGSASADCIIYICDNVNITALSPTT